MSTDQQAIERQAATLYEQCHPEETFDDLKRRAPFSKEDRMLLRDWRAAAAVALSRRPAGPTAA